MGSRSHPKQRNCFMRLKLWALDLLLAPVSNLLDSIYITLQIYWKISTKIKMLFWRVQQYSMVVTPWWLHHSQVIFSHRQATLPDKTWDRSVTGTTTTIWQYCTQAGGATTPSKYSTFVKIHLRSADILYFMKLVFETCERINYKLLRYKTWV